MRYTSIIIAFALLNVGCASIGPGLTYGELLELNTANPDPEVVEKYCTSSKYYSNSLKCKGIELTEDEKILIDYYLVQ